MEPALKKVRLIYWTLLVTILLLAGITEFLSHDKGNNDWTWRQWMAVGLSAWAISGASSLRGRLLSRAKEILKNESPAARGVKSWEAGYVIGLAVAEGVAYWGIAIRFVFHGAFWQASLFYAGGLLLLIHWRPRRPSTTTFA